MNKILSFFNSRLMCGGGRSDSTRNKQFREEELLSSDRERNFNFRLYKSNQEGGGRYLILPSLIRDKNIGGGRTTVK